MHYLPENNSISGGFKPEHSNSYYYRGDETREIGWRSFNVGVFKFILPSFSSSSPLSSSSANRQSLRGRNENGFYLTVPPPNDRPKSVAYILDLSTQISISNSTLAKAKTLSKSIRRMHADSKYGYYKIYAIANSETASRLSKVGFEVIDSTYIEGEGGESYDIILNSTEIKTNNMYKLWRRHRIIINLSGFHLHSSWNLDSLFDILLSKNSLRFPGINSFLLQPHRSSMKGREEILIFDGSSHQAFDSFIKLRSCFKTSRIKGEEGEPTKSNTNERDDSLSCIDQVGSNRGLAICTYHQDFIDCSKSMMTKDFKS